MSKCSLCNLSKVVSPLNKQQTSFFAPSVVFIETAKVAVFVIKSDKCCLILRKAIASSSQVEFNLRHIGLIATQDR